MNRAQYLALGAMLIVALTAPAQQTAAVPRTTHKDAAQADIPTVEQQLKVLTDKLDLTRVSRAESNRPSNNYMTPRRD